MRKRPPGCTHLAQPENHLPDDLGNSVRVGINAISIEELSSFIDEFLYDCEYRRHSARTLEEERSVLHKLLRYLQETDSPHSGPSELRRYLMHVAEGGLRRGCRQRRRRPPAAPA